MYRLPLYLLAGMIYLVLLSGCDGGTQPGTSPRFEKYKGNPVLPERPIGATDRWRSDPFVVKEDGVYKMWFGYNTDGNKTQIGYATSPDGINWTVDQLPAIPLGTEGEWDDEDVETPFVVKANGVYHMYYCARGAPEGSDQWKEFTYQIGHATSPDGINWIKDPGNPVLGVGEFDSDEWDALIACEPSVIYRDGGFELFYVGGHGEEQNGTGVFILELGLATSSDGSNWKRYAGNPILKSTIDDIGAPFVLYNGSGYELWYTGVPIEVPYFPEGPFWYYTSPDGITWTKAETTALEKGTNQEWDSSGIFAPTVIIDEDRQKMWYSGYYYDGAEQLDFAIGYATRDYYGN